MTHGDREHREGGGQATRRGDGDKVTQRGTNGTNGGGVLSTRDYYGEVRAAEPASEQPDVLLDVPVLKVDEIELEVENLRAHVSLQSEVLDLLKLNVGADVLLGSVHLDIKGVEAQALLKVRLDHVAQIIERVLTTIDQNPQILEHVTRGAGAALEDVGGGARQAVGEVGRGAGSAVEDVGGGARQAVGEVGRGAGSAVEDVGSGAQEAVGETGEVARDAAGLGPAGIASRIARSSLRAGLDGLLWLKDQTTRLTGDSSGDAPGGDRPSGGGPSGDTSSDASARE
jgi:hypothetical protein